MTFKARFKAEPARSLWPIDRGFYSYRKHLFGYLRSGEVTGSDISHIRGS